MKIIFQFSSIISVFFKDDFKGIFISEFCIILKVFITSSFFICSQLDHLDFISKIHSILDKSVKLHLDKSGINFFCFSS